MVSMAKHGECNAERANLMMECMKVGNHSKTKRTRKTQFGIEG